ncbi:MAG: hypothetical protein HQM00_00835, partial [Magnetococcales bacterium]|nr:hypothetical protein [Magnetococcales bacterium]
RDAWFIGISPSLVAGVWVGMDDFSILGETGGTAALPIWMDFMQEALQGQPATDFAVPPGISLEEIDAESGTLPGPHTANRVFEAFKPGQMPAAIASAPEESGSGGGGDVQGEEAGISSEPATAPATGGVAPAPARGGGVSSNPGKGTSSGGGVGAIPGIGRHGQGEMDGGLY